MSLISHFQDELKLVFNEKDTLTKRLICRSTIPITCSNPSLSTCSLKFSLQYKNLAVRVNRVIIKECSEYSDGLVKCDPNDKVMKPSKIWKKSNSELIWDIAVSLESKNLNFFIENYELELKNNIDSELRPFFQNFKIPKISVIIKKN